jgi:hypothetical protein
MINLPNHRSFIKSREERRLSLEALPMFWYQAWPAGSVIPKNTSTLASRIADGVEKVLKTANMSLRHRRTHHRAKPSHLSGRGRDCDLLSRSHRIYLRAARSALKI